jgi:hypothetical protein
MASSDISRGLVDHFEADSLSTTPLTRDEDAIRKPSTNPVNDLLRAKTTRKGMMSLMERSMT